MRAVITVVGKDAVGIIAEVSAVLKHYSANIVDITQSVLSDLFAMVLLADISGCTVDFPVLADALKNVGERMHLDVHVMHEDIFNAMHKI